MTNSPPSSQKEKKRDKLRRYLGWSESSDRKVKSKVSNASLNTQCSPQQQGNSQEQEDRPSLTESSHASHHSSSSAQTVQQEDRPSLTESSHASYHSSSSAQTVKQEDRPSLTESSHASYHSSSSAQIVKQVPIPESSHASYKPSSSPSVPSPPVVKQVPMDIFPENLPEHIPTIELSRPQERIEKTEQLVYCNAVINQISPHPSPTTADQDAQQKPVLDKVQQDWLAEIEKNPTERDHMQWLMASMVQEFIQDANKDSTEIAEMVALAPVLNREHYRKLLSSFIKDFTDTAILDADLLQGLVQMTQCATSRFLEPDDLVIILGIIRTRLEGTHLQTTHHPFHLTLSVSRILDVMADHKVQDLSRVLHHEPLAAILSGLKESSDPYLLYQACYAFQALQYVPDEETTLQAFLRHSTGVVDGFIKVSGLIQLDLEGLLEGIKEIQKTVEETVGLVKSMWEGARSLIDSGRGVFDSLREGLGSGHKRPWYIAIRGAARLVRERRLADLNELIIKVSCRRDPMFQWGICQLLGEIADDPVWSVATRQQAMELLRALYQDDQDWAQDDSVKTWMTTIIGKLSKASDHEVEATASDLAVQVTALTLLQQLGSDDALSTLPPYPLRSRTSILIDSPVLSKVQKIPLVEHDLHIFRLLRLNDIRLPIYIPPSAKANLKAQDDDDFLLLEKVQEFLASERQVMLILGDSGAGKSTFNLHLEHHLWNEYKKDGDIPLFINLPSIPVPEVDMIKKQLKTYGFSVDQIQELKKHRRFFLICDGYDESQRLINLHKANLLNQPGQWNTKMIISCRSQYLGQNYHSRFMPQSSSHYRRTPAELFQEAVITPFSGEQIEKYVEKYVEKYAEEHVLLRPWTTQDYMVRLETIPHLMELVKNPFLLTLALEALPDVIAGEQDLSAINITRVRLYDTFVKRWLSFNQTRLENSTLSDPDRRILDDLSNSDFVAQGIDYAKRLATAIFEKQGRITIVQYSPIDDKATWKNEFFRSDDASVRFLQEASPLRRTGNEFRFIHRSIQDYFFSCTVFSPVSHDGSDDHDSQSDPEPADASILGTDNPLFKSNLLVEQSVVRFLSERVQQHQEFKSLLLAVIEKSKTDPAAATGATNAITILVKAGVTFHGADLRKICIPGADLSDGPFDSVRFNGANLTNVNFARCWLRQADFKDARMEGIRFGELPYLDGSGHILAITYSPDGKRLAAGRQNGAIDIYDTTTRLQVHRLKGHDKPVFDVAYSPDSRRLVSVSDDKTVKLWDADTGKMVSLMEGHEDGVTSVAYSPCGKQIASVSSDSTMIVWDSEKREAPLIFTGTVDRVNMLAYSPDGKQIVSGGSDGTIRYWDLETEKSIKERECPFGAVWSLAYSTDGRRIATGHERGEIQLWDAETRDPALILRGHTKGVTGVAFSPKSSKLQWIASCSSDASVRLWDVSAGVLVFVFAGHRDFIWSLSFSPDGAHIASGAEDGKVRLWEVNPSESQFEQQGHTGPIIHVSYSPDGQHILSTGSEDGTIRQWNSRTGVLGPVVLRQNKIICRVAYSSDGDQIATAGHDKIIRLWDRHTSEPGASWGGHDNSILCMAYSPRGRWLASTSLDQTTRLWDLRGTGLDHVFTQQLDDEACSMTFSPSGDQIAVGDVNGAVWILDAQWGDALTTIRLQEKMVSALAYSPDSQHIAIGTSSGTIHLRDFGLIGSIEELHGHTARVVCLAYSRCGQWIVSGSDDGTVRLWYFRENRWTRANVITGFVLAIQSIAWSPTETLEFVTGCDDHSVRVWRISSTPDSGSSSNMCVTMVWGSNTGQLVVADVEFKGAKGLNAVSKQLLIQRGARDGNNVETPQAGELIIEHVLLSDVDVESLNVGGGNRERELWCDDDMMLSDSDGWPEEEEDDEEEVQDDEDDELKEVSD